jgi:twitching motility two-component system response regulator PilH
VSEHARKRVIVVDDDPDIRALVGRVLSDAYDVQTFADGETALAAVRADPPALVLLDLMMPRMDGEAFLMRMRVQLGDAAPPVALLTASSQRTDVARRHGVAAALDKPFELDDVRELVDSLVQRSSRP